MLLVVPSQVLFYMFSFRALFLTPFLVLQIPLIGFTCHFTSHLVYHSDYSLRLIHCSRHTGPLAICDLSHSDLSSTLIRNKYECLTTTLE